MTVEDLQIPDPTSEVVVVVVVVVATTRAIHAGKSTALIPGATALAARHHRTVPGQTIVSPGQGNLPRGINPVNRLLLPAIVPQLRLQVSRVQDLKYRSDTDIVGQHWTRSGILSNASETMVSRGRWFGSSIVFRDDAMVMLLYWRKCLLLVGERKFYGHMTAKDSQHVTTKDYTN